MAALMLDDAPSATVRQWYDNIYMEFMLYCDHYAHFAQNWGCCGGCERYRSDSISTCGILPLFVLSVNDTIFTDKYVPSVMPYVVENTWHEGCQNECRVGSEICAECRHFQRDDIKFIYIKFKCWDINLFDTNAKLESYISDRVYNLSQLNFRHYALDINTLMLNTLKKFYQLLFVSGKHTKAACR
jgi:hypothetical protein